MSANYSPAPRYAGAGGSSGGGYGAGAGAGAGAGGQYGDRYGQMGPRIPRRLYAVSATAGVINWMENRVFQRDFRDFPDVQPQSIYARKVSWVALQPARFSYALDVHSP